MEFRAHLPGLDEVGGTISLHCLGWGPTPYALRETPGLTSVVWDTGDRVLSGTPAEQLAENQRQEAVVQAAAAQFVDQAGNLAFVYDGSASDHLRIYGLDRTPPELVSRYLANRPPGTFDWGLLKLQKVVSLGATDLGDIPLMEYQDDQGNPVCRRQFSFQYTTAANGATTLAVTETPGWCRNDGSWADGPARTETYTGARYNAWRDSARRRIFEFLKTYLPLVLVELAEASNVPEGEAVSGGWLAANHAAQWNLYMETGRKEAIEASITADPTGWLSEVVPDETVPGLPDESTVREFILGALR